MTGRPGHKSSSIAICASTSAQQTSAVPWAVIGVLAPAVGSEQGCTGRPALAQQ